MRKEQRRIAVNGEDNIPQRTIIYPRHPNLDRSALAHSVLLSTFVTPNDRRLSGRATEMPARSKAWLPSVRSNRWLDRPVAHHRRCRQPKRPHRARAAAADRSNPSTLKSKTGTDRSAIDSAVDSSIMTDSMTRRFQENDRNITANLEHLRSQTHTTILTFWQTRCDNLD